MNPKLKKSLLTILKIGVSLGLMAWVLQRLDWEHIGEIFQEVNIFFFGLSVVFYIASQLVSVARFNLFIRKIGIRISFWTNSKLYLLGMFYNFFIPGGIGGDAYKAYVLSKAYKKSLKSLGKIVFLDRFIGLVAIGFTVCILLVFIEIPYSDYLKWIVILVGLIGVVIVLRLANRFFHTHKKRIYWGFLYSILIQGLQLLSVWCIMQSFAVDGNTVIYLTMFLISSVLGIVSFAGLGIREAVFYYGAHWFNFNENTSTIIALSFSLMTAAISFLGIIFIFKKIQFQNSSKPN
ncbi:lysylphosphatidylglycerol synthase transmembrane domain-containing protein [Moheibacter sediminis]|uniref:Lysylphosphatidylglycerol synthase TM region n=1 Tax=Moheibacter sediminis TaxID=1434700 RepID=A0A1W1ZKK0_9FLAO|nr:lysylphosphatidylglycerol synthase transmembrane domain-containing protein [Moheibacter sediminis]SMC49075.1 hypothetical protein SAMN06296427_10344 [Moheibacter sediminis]